MDDSTDDDDHRNACALDLAADGARRRARARLRSKIAALIQHINKPLPAIIAEHALPFLPPRTLHCLRSVSSSWNRHLSSPIFTHTQSRAIRSPSGIFLRGPAFLPFDPKSDSIPDPTLSFLPHRMMITIMSSSNGLVCCNAGSTYVICNPSTTQWTRLPTPNTNRTVNRDAVLIFDPSVYNFGSDYFLVCAFAIREVPGVYGLDVYSSESGTWRTSNEIFLAEKIVFGSGISAGGLACWRTTMQTVAIYDPAADRARVVTWPAGYDGDAMWEMAAIAGKLCCVAVSRDLVSVYTLGDGDRWAPRADYLATPEGSEGWRWLTREGGIGAEVWEGDPRPLRFQSGNLDAVVAVEDEVYVLDLLNRRVKHVMTGLETGYDRDTVVYISTLAPVHPQAK